MTSRFLVTHGGAIKEEQKKKKKLERNRKDNGEYGTTSGFLSAVLLEMPIKSPNEDVK